MKRLIVLGLGAALMLGLIAAPAHAGVAKVRIPTKVVIGGFNYDGDTDIVTFRGHITCKKSCRKGRKVSLTQIDAGILAGSDRTSKSGRWRIRFRGDDVPVGSVRAKAAKKVLVKKRGGAVVKKTICKPGRSPVFEPFPM